MKQTHAELSRENLLPLRLMMTNKLIEQTHSRSSVTHVLACSETPEAVTVSCVTPVTASLC